MNPFKKKHYPKLLSSILITFLLTNISFLFVSIEPASASPGLTLKWTRSLGGYAKTDIGPLAANLVGDERLEIIVTGGSKDDGTDGTVTVLDGTTGNIIWQVVPGGIGMHSPCEIADINNDGKLEIVVSGINPVVLHGSNGSIYWKNTAVSSDNLFSPVFDVDGDGYSEVFVSSGAGPYVGYDYITSLAYDGKMISQAWCWHPCWGGLALGDANFDGRFELYQGDRAYNYNYESDPFKFGGMGVRALDALTLTPLWNDSTVTCSSHTPMLADVDKDGILDVIVANQGTANGGLAVYRAIDGSVLTTGGKYRKGLSLGLPSHSQPTVADIDGDGNLEIITCRSTNPKIWDLYEWKLDATLPIVCIEPPKVGDVTGDGKLDIIAVTGSEIYVYSYDEVSKTYVEVDRITGLGSPNAFTLLQDVDGDGYNELIVTSQSGYVYCFDMTAPAPSPRVRSEAQFYSERHLGAAEYVPPPGPLAPMISEPSPLHGATDVSISLSQLTFTLTDFQKDKMNYTVITNPDIGTANGINVANGKCTVSINGLDYSTTYTWTVSATDGTNSNSKTFTFTTSDVPPWYNTDWQYRKQITIDHTKVSATQTNFPVLIDLTDGSLKTKAQIDGDDFAFTDQDNNKLNHEIELYDSTTGHLTAWVNVPYLSSIADTVLYMYYGNPTCGNQQNTAAVWDTSYKLVLHLDEKTGTHYDSTVNGNNGTPLNGVVQGVTGKIDGADTFDGVNDYVEIPHSTTLTGYTQAFTASFWIKLEDTSRRQAILNKYNQGTSQKAWFIEYNPVDRPTRPFGFYASQDGTNYQEWYANFVPTANTWYYVTVVWEASTIPKFYVNGAQVSTVGTATISSIYNNAGVPLHIARCPYNTARYLKGSLDEIRISNPARSASYILTCYNNQLNPSAFYTISAEEALPGEPMISDPNPAKNSTNVPITLSELSFNLTDYQHDPMNFTVTTTPDIGSASQTNVPNGRYTIPVSGLAYATIYNWTVTVTDGTHTTTRTYGFTTEQAPAADDIIFNSNFDMGNLINPTYQTGAPGYRYYTAATNYTTVSFADKHWWFYFSMDNVAGKTITVKIVNGTTADYSTDATSGNRWPNIEPVYSYDNINWQRVPLSGVTFDRTARTFTINVTVPIGYDKIWLAPLPPYNIAKRDALFAEFASNPYLTVTSLGTTPGGQELKVATITDSAYPDAGKFKSYVTAQQHAGEVPGSWNAEGLIRYLLSDDPTAAAIRRSYIFRIIPIVNVDGVYQGVCRYTPLRSGVQYDTNRQWNLALATMQAQTPEVFWIYQDIQAFQPNSFNDMHSTINQEQVSPEEALTYRGTTTTAYTNFMDRIRDGGWPETVRAASTLAGGAFQNVRSRLGVTFSLSWENPHDELSSNRGTKLTANDWMTWGPGWARGNYLYFGDAKATLTVSIIGSGSVAKNPDTTTYAYGTSVQLTATAGAGYTFSHWTGDLTGSDNPATILMNGNKSVTAVFIESEFSLNINVEGSGSVSRNYTGPYYYGSVVQLTATASPSWIFSEWSGDLTGNENPATIIITQNMSITAHFTGQNYTIIASVTGIGGTIDPSGSITVTHGQNQTFIMNPDIGYHVSDVLIDDLSIGPTSSYTFYTIDQNHTITAMFAQNEYTLTVHIIGSGSVAKNPEETTYTHGETVELTATANTGWTFSGWSGDLTGLTNPAMILMNGNKTVTATFTDNQWLSIDWKYRRTITIDRTKVSGTQTNFPVIIDLTDSGLTGKAQPDGDDFLFTDASNAKLNHEIELYDSTIGRLVVWVNVPSMSSTADTVLYMYYGNPTCGNQQNPAVVWDTSFKLVLHLDEKTGMHYDSTINGNNGTPLNGVVQGVAGKIDGSDTFDGVNDYVEIPHSNTLAGYTEAFTSSFWIKLEDTSRRQAILNKYNQGTNQRAWFIEYNPVDRPTRPFGFYASQDGTNYREWYANFVPTANTWYYVTVVWEANTIPKFYVNGAQVSTVGTSTIASIYNNVGVPLHIARCPYNTARYLKGSLDEITISNPARSASWILTTYNNQKDPSTFYAVGAEESFEELYALTVTIDGHGSVTIDPEKTYYTSGETVTLTATPDTGYEFTGWTGDLTGLTNPAIITMTANKIITAHFTIKQYTITASVTGTGGTIEPSGSVKVPLGENQTFTITPDIGYHILDVVVDDEPQGPLSTYTFYTVDMNHTITATFAPNEYTLTVTASPESSGSVSKNPDKTTYTYGEIITLNASANVGYVFTGWSGDLTGSQNPVNITITGNKTVTATFEVAIEYTLTVDVVGSGSVTKVPDQATYTQGTVVALTAVPITGWSFSGWSGDLTGNQNQTTITMNSSKSITATFTQDQYTLTITVVGDGTVAKDPDQATYTYGQTVTLTASPSVGYSFTGWSGDLTGSVSPTDIIMIGNKNVTATFTQNQYTLTVNVSSGGSVSKSPNKATYIYGENVTLTATPNVDYTFSGWSGDLTGNQNPVNITITANKNVTATFTAINYNDVAFDSSFDMGNLRNVQFQSGDASGNRLYTGEQNHTTVSFSDKHWWFYFSMENVAGKTVTIRLVNNEAVDFTGNRWPEIEPVYSFDNINWERLPLSNVVVDGTARTFQMTVPSSLTSGHSKIWLAPLPPYTIGRRDALFQEFASSPYLTVTSLGTTPGGQELKVATITDTAYSDAGKFKSYVIAQQHVGEVGSWNAEGLIRYLLSNDPTAAAIRRSYIFKIVPIVNVDGVYQGVSRYTPLRSGVQYDLNRDWSSSPTTPEITWIRQDILTFQPDSFNDMHSTINTEQQSPKEALTYTWDYTNPTVVSFMDKIKQGGWPETYRYNTGSTYAAPRVHTWLNIAESVSWENPHDELVTNPGVKLTVNDWMSWGAGWAKGNYLYFGDAHATLTISTVGSGSVAKNPDAANYTYGTSVQLTATPGVGYTFSYWTGDLTGSVNPATIVINGSKTITAVFTQNEYTLTINIVGEGSVGKTPDQTTYTHGTVVQLTATAASGWTFTGWSGDITSLQNPINITMNGNKIVTATFTQDQYTLTIDIDGDGSVSKIPDQPTYAYGTEIQLTATTSVGWEFSHWSGALSGSANPENITLTGDASVTAHFAPVEYVLTINTVGNGSVTRNDTGPYYYGSVVELTAVPADGWVFSGWGGDLGGSANPESIIVDGNKTVTATFTQNEYTLTTIISPENTGQVNLNQTGPYHYGDIIELTAIPIDGWSFTEWTGDLTGSISPATIQITGNVEATAVFTQLEYTLTITVAPESSGSVALNNTGPYHYGDTVELTASPAVGYSFSEWTGNLSGSDSPTTILIDSHKFVTATFERIEYALNVTIVGNGSVNMNNTGPYYPETVVELTATADPGWHFVDWSGDVTSTENSIIITTDSNKSVTATFAQNEYTLTVAASPEGSGSIDLNNTGPYHYGDVIRLEAVPSTGWSFSHWEGDLSGGVNPTTITIDDNKSVTTVFAQNQYTLTIVTDGNGSVTRDPDQATYPYGTNVTLTATADPGWSFSHWSGNLTGLTNPATLNITDHKTVTAHFTQEQYTLTINTDGSGSVLKAPDQAAYTYGTEVQLTAVADPGWSFSGWSGDISSYANPVNITMTGNATVNATFTKNEYILTVTVDGSGSVTRNASEPYYYGDVVELTAVPTIGWSFSEWTGDLTGNVSPATKEITSNMTVTAHFTQDQYTLTIDIVGNGSVTKNPDQPTYTYNTDVELTATADIGWSFSHWTDDLTGSDNPATIAMTSDKTVTAHFTQIEYSINITIVGNGYVSRNDSEPYYYGSAVQLTATADPSWTFSEWSGDLSGTANPAIIIIDGNKSVTATFIEALGIDASFESASIGTYTIIGNQIDLTILGEPVVNTGGTYTYWTYFEVDNVDGRTVTFRVTNAIDIDFLTKTTEETQMVYSYDGENWLRFPTGTYSGGVYTFSTTFTGDNDVYVATFFPFTYTEMSDYIDSIDPSPYIETSVLGLSEQGREIRLVKVTNTAIPEASKQTIYIIGRQHSAETCSSFMIKGLIDFLLTDDPVAQNSRDAFVYYIVPMVNPDGVVLGKSRVTSENRDANRDWHETVSESVEINAVRANIDAIDASNGIDFFIDWHSQMDDSSWSNFIYSPIGNTFFPILSSWTDFDRESQSSYSYPTASCSARGYVMTIIQPGFMATFEPTPHLSTWTTSSLQEQGRLVAMAIEDYYGPTPMVHLEDPTFEASADSDDLRSNATGQDWYESRGTLASALTLDTSNVAGNTGKKAALKTYSDTSTNSVYLTQELSSPQTGSFSVSCDINIDQIFGDSQNLNRGAYIFLGDALGTTTPNAGGARRFVQLAFWDSTPGTSGDDIKLMAREYNNNDGTPPYDPWLDPSTWNEVKTGLSYDTWYNIRIDVNFAAGTYDVYVNGVLAKAGILKYEQYASASITHLSFAIGGVSTSGFGRGDFYVDNVYAPAAEQYTLTVSTAGSGSVTKSPDKATYNSGESVQLTATADPGWSFSDWSGDLIGYANPATITMDGHKSVVANFTQNTYTLTVSTDGSGSVNRNNSGPYHYDDIVELTAVPATGWSFDHWSGDLSGSTNPTTILIDGNKAVNATFTENPPNEYSLIVNVIGNGAVTKDPDQATYSDGTTVTLNATPAVGWSFSGWSDDLSGSANPVDLLMDDNKVVNATFTQNNYTLTVTVIGSGSVVLNNTGPYHYGDTVQLTANLTVGWSFSGWSGNLSGSLNPATLTVDGDESVTATFTENQYSLTVNVVGNGSVSKAPDQLTYTYDTAVELNATATSGWIFTGWTGDLSGSSNPATITMTSSKTVNATFSQILITDSDFDASANSTDLRLNGAGQDWFESRGGFSGGNSSLLVLNDTDIWGNTGNKASLANYGIAQNSYLTQNFSSAQTGVFSVSFDILIDRIQDNANYDRTGHIYIGDNRLTADAITGGANERFLILAFYDPTPGDTGNDLQLRARTLNTTAQSWSNTTSWVQVATGLSNDTWYTIRIELNVAAGTYDVYVDGILKGNDIPRMNGYTPSSVEYITFALDSDARGDFYVDNVFSPSQDALVSAFTIIDLPDTQFYSESYPSIFDNQTQWIVDNAVGMNIDFVLHEGDLVNSNTNVAQWVNANDSMSLLDGHVPWAVLPGNHDGTDVGGSSENLIDYNMYFSYSRFSGEAWYGGAYNDVNTNNFVLFSGGKDDYIIFSFQYHPSDAVLAWANATIEAHPDRRAIVVTHDYLNTDGTRTTEGNHIWNSFIIHHADQIFLVLCGHMHGEAKRQDTVGGHIVYQVLADYQDRTNGGDGWLRIIEFHPAEDKIYIKTFSPYKNIYETDADSQFTLYYDMTDPN